MVWLILFLLAVASIVTVCILHSKAKSNYWRNAHLNILLPGIIMAMLAGVLFIANLGDGITDYPWLLAKRAEVKSYQMRIDDIKKARYAYKKDGLLVAGSVENIKQSTVLSEYIEKVVKAESEYSSYVQRCKTSVKTPILWWFGQGAFIDKRVLDLPDHP